MPADCSLYGDCSPERARRVAETLLQPESFSGWGAANTRVQRVRYNPLSYHNGSVWPHDNSLYRNWIGEIRDIKSWWKTFYESSWIE